MKEGKEILDFPLPFIFQPPPEPLKLRHKEADTGPQWEQRPAESSFPIRQSSIGKNREMDPANIGWINDLELQDPASHFMCPRIRKFICFIL